MVSDCGVAGAVTSEPATQLSARCSAHELRTARRLVRAVLAKGEAPGMPLAASALGPCGGPGGSATSPRASLSFFGDTRGARAHSSFKREAPGTIPGAWRRERSESRAADAQLTEVQV